MNCRRRLCCSHVVSSSQSHAHSPVPRSCFSCFFFFFFNDTATTEIYTLSLHDALPIWSDCPSAPGRPTPICAGRADRSEEHTSELQSPCNLVCRLLLEKKKTKKHKITPTTTDGVRGRLLTASTSTTALGACATR